MGVLGGCPVLDCCRTAGHLCVPLPNLVGMEEKVAELEEIGGSSLPWRLKQIKKSALLIAGVNSVFSLAS